MNPEQTATLRRSEERKGYTSALAFQLAVVQVRDGTTETPEAIARRAFDVAQAVCKERELREQEPML